MVARAGSQELSANHLADLIGNAKVPLRRDVANAVAQIWVSYQLLGYAGAHDDTLRDAKVADAAMWSAVAQEKSKAFYAQRVEGLDQGRLRDAAGEVRGRRHARRAPHPADGAARRHGARVARLGAQRAGEDPQDGDGGQLRRRGQARSRWTAPRRTAAASASLPAAPMVPEFEAAVRAIKPGEVSGVFETQFGFHIVKRQTYDEVAAEFAKAYGQIAAQKAESTFLAGIEKGANVQVKSGAAKLVKAIAEDVDAHRDDRTTLATWRSGSLTAARLVQWMGAMPPQSRIREGLAQAPDSAIPYFLKQIARNEKNELILKIKDYTRFIRTLNPNIFNGYITFSFSRSKIFSSYTEIRSSKY